MIGLLIAVIVGSFVVNAYLVHLLVKLSDRANPLDLIPEILKDRDALRRVALSTIPEPRSHVRLVEGGQDDMEGGGAGWDGVEYPDPSDSFLTDPHRAVNNADLPTGPLPYDPAWEG